MKAQLSAVLFTTLNPHIFVFAAVYVPLVLTVLYIPTPLISPMNDMREFIPRYERGVVPTQRVQVMLAFPATSSFWVGVVVPIPTLPLLRRRINSVELLPNANPKVPHTGLKSIYH